MRKNLILILIVLIAGLVRLYRIDGLPALNADEAALGYNAYSLLETGKDEHGNSWPIHFQSFNDYKPGLFFYVILPFVKVLGLNVWAVRIPGVAFGVGSVLMIYLLAKVVIKDEIVAIVSSFFLAISPWHIHFSRGAWEVNMSTFLIICGIYFFYKALDKSWYFVLSSLFLVLSLYTYHAARVVVPLLGFGLLILYKKEIFKNLKFILVSISLSGILLFPLLFDILGQRGLSRVAGVGLFADLGPLSRINEQRGEHGDYTGVRARVLHNKVVNYSLAFLDNWGKHYGGDFLFISGDEIQRNKVPETGEMYLADIIFVVVGLISIIKKPSKDWTFIIIWLIVAPVASSLTFQSPHALRAHNMVIPLIIISSYGFVKLLEKVVWVRMKLLRISSYAFLIFLILWCFVRYQRMYYLHMAKEYPFSSQYAVKNLVNYLKDEKKEYQKIIVTDRYDQPYILFLFYLKYPPSKFQKEHTLTKRDKYGFSTVRNFGNYEFKLIKYDEIRPISPNSLIIGTDEEIPKETNIVKQIYGENGLLYFEVVAN